MYGGAEFVKGQEEVEVPIVVATSTVAAPAASHTAALVTPPIVSVPETDAAEESSAAEYTLLQKGLFFAVIVGCVFGYMKMSGGKKATRYQEKSMA